MDAPRPCSYHRTTIYLTEEQRQWLARLAAQAWLEGSTLSASDVIRYALISLQERLPEEELREAVIKHVHSKAKLYPGRARGASTQFGLGCTKPLIAGHASAVNVAVNENPAEPCLCLPCQMPSDQHHDRVCLLLHPTSND